MKRNLLFVLLAVLGFALPAEVQAKDITVYLKKTATTYNIWAWEGSTNFTGDTWPGEKFDTSNENTTLVTIEGVDYYKRTFTVNSTLSFLLNFNGDDYKSGDLSATGDIFLECTHGNNKATPKELPDPREDAGIYVYFKDPKISSFANSWNAELKFYAWREPTNMATIAYFGSWGSEQQPESIVIDDITYYWKKIPTMNPANLIIHAGSAQTPDIKNITSTTFYELKSEKQVQTIADPRVLANPTISQKGNVVTISNVVSKTGKIYYTTDGTEPTEESTVYTGEFTPEANCTIKAKEIGTNCASSVVEFNYVKPHDPTFDVQESDDHFVYFTTDPCENVKYWAKGYDYYYLPTTNKVSKQPEELYILGNLKIGNWDTAKGIKGVQYGSAFVFENVEFAPEGDNKDVYFSFTSKLADETNDWNGIGTRYAPESDLKFEWETKATFVNGSKAFEIAYSADKTYNIVVDFATSTVVVTEHSAADMEWADMEPVSAETHGISYAGKFLWRMPLVNGVNLTFFDGEKAINAGTATEDKSYIVYNNELVHCPTVAAVPKNMDPEYEFLFINGSHLLGSNGTVRVGYNMATDPNGAQNDDMEIVPELGDDNARVVLSWWAENEYGVRFHDSREMINGVNETPVFIYARKPSTWSAIEVTFTSALDNKVIHTDSIVGTPDDNNFIEYKVPAHLVHSSVKFSNKGAKNGPQRVGGEILDVNDSITHELEGQTKYWSDQAWADKAEDVIAADAAVSGISDIEAEAAPVEYYNMQGIRVTNPTNGVYIRRQGNTVTKVTL